MLGMNLMLASLMGCSNEKPAFKAVDITGADYAQGWELTDHNGQVRTLKEFAGKAVIVFFGYTQCPDVCPTSMQELVEVKRLLGADGERLQGIFITVDPERDTTELLKAYMANFDPSFVALRPAVEQLPKVTKDFKIYFKKVDGSTPTSYTMDHSAGSFTFDPQGRIRLYNRYGMGAPALADDLKILLKGG
jgi:protein SCO1/2